MKHAPDRDTMTSSLTGDWPGLFAGPKAVFRRYSSHEHNTLPKGHKARRCKTESAIASSRFKHRCRLDQEVAVDAGDEMSAAR